MSSSTRAARDRTETANDLGGILFGTSCRARIQGYARAPRLRPAAGDDEAVRPARLLTSTNQTINPDGYGYMTTRDGVSSPYTTHPPSDILGVLGCTGLPIPPALTNLLNTLPIFTRRRGRSRRPTLIEYSGYGTADPDGPESGISVVANLMGYTVVDVNMRGTGCSGGAYDFFEPLQGLDGYDVIETVARQPWVKGSKVGMFGISFGGISQLFTAQYQPPSLAAIRPLSVIDQTQTTLYPGGGPEHGLRVQLGRRPRPRRSAGSRRPALGERPDRERERPDRRPLPGEPGAPPRGGGPPREDRRERLLRPRGGRPALAEDLRRQDQRPDLPRLPVDRRADRRALPDARLGDARPANTDKKWFTFTNGTHVDSAQTRDAHPPLRLPPDLRGPGGAPLRRRRSDLGGHRSSTRWSMGITGVTPKPRRPIC